MLFKTFATIFAIAAIIKFKMFDVMFDVSLWIAGITAAVWVIAWAVSRPEKPTERQAKGYGPIVRDR